MLVHTVPMCFTYRNKMVYNIVGYLWHLKNYRLWKISQHPSICMNLLHEHSATKIDLTTHHNP